MPPPITANHQPSGTPGRWTAAPSASGAPELPPAVTPSDILLARDVLGLGMSRRAFYEALRTGRLIRLRPGADIDADLWQRLSPRERRIADHLAFALTRPAALSRPPVFSHDSALLLHGLSLVALPSRLHVAGSPRPHRHAADVTTHEDPYAQARVHLAGCDGQAGGAEPRAATRPAASGLNRAVRTGSSGSRCTIRSTGRYRGSGG